MGLASRNDFTVADVQDPEELEKEGVNWTAVLSFALKTTVKEDRPAIRFSFLLHRVPTLERAKNKLFMTATSSDRP
jgi:hypothetical protein